MQGSGKLQMSTSMWSCSGNDFGCLQLLTASLSHQSGSRVVNYGRTCFLNSLSHSTSLMDIQRVYVGTGLVLSEHMMCIAHFCTVSSVSNCNRESRMPNWAHIPISVALQPCRNAVGRYLKIRLALAFWESTGVMLLPRTQSHLRSLNTSTPKSLNVCILCQLLYHWVGPIWR